MNPPGQKKIDYDSLPPMEQVPYEFRLRNYTTLPVGNIKVRTPVPTGPAPLPSQDRAGSVMPPPPDGW
ncbi:hypothetical protein MN0502_30050 [Arthrobacter sp. MN05-02]|nr:hypothetical protein MN0502_30050 [Arthrobacter sp. MN05-02]